MGKKRNRNNKNKEANDKLENPKPVPNPVNSNFNTQPIYHNDENDIKKKDSNSFVKYGNWSERFGILINSIMLVCTFLLFRQAFRQNQIAEKNIAISDSMFVLSKRVFDSAISSQIDAEKKSQISFNLQKKLINLQVQSFENSKKEFETVNDVEIKIDNHSYDPGLHFIVGKPISKKLIVTTIGTNKIKILSVASNIKISNTAPTINDINKIHKKENLNFYSSANNPPEFIISSDFNLTKTDSLWVDQYKWQHVFIYGRIIYFNNLTKKTKKYDFILQFSDNGISFEYINPE